MEVRIIKAISNLEVGEVKDLPPPQARELIRDGYAVLNLIRSFTVEDTRSKHKSEKTVTL